MTREQKYLYQLIRLRWNEKNENNVKVKKINNSLGAYCVKQAAVMAGKPMHQPGTAPCKHGY